MDHADDIVQRTLIDRYARMSLPGHRRHDLVKRYAVLNRIDIGARNHHVLDRHRAQFQHVGDQGMFFRVDRLGLFLALLDQRLDAVAQRHFAVALAT